MSRALLERFLAVRGTTADLAAPLSAEDQLVQSMPDASPTKWHLAHTTWFFERFLLAAHVGSYRPFAPDYDRLFNSYYVAVGTAHPRPQRGVLSRPGAEEILAYRRYVDQAIAALLEARGDEAEIDALVTLGMHHEQQHQELLLTDIKHAFASHPLLPAYRAPLPPARGEAPPLRFVEQPGGLVELGAAARAGFSFDNERPRHRVFIEPFALGNRLVTCGEYLDFMRDGGYQRPALWLSAGWEAVVAGGWRAPLYFVERDGAWWQQTLGGPRPVAPAEPVCHVSHFEADAYARWAGARLPTEAEWELAVGERPVSGTLLEGGRLHPDVAPHEPLAQLFGDAWEWTQSAYAPYPGFRPLAGALGEYNGKFMSGQLVLRGGSCLTPATHLRVSYRNFFPPGARWQCTGIRLARDPS